MCVTSQKFTYISQHVKYIIHIAAALNIIKKFKQRQQYGTNSNLPLSSQNTENDANLETNGRKSYNPLHKFPQQDI
jgi:cytoskeletal protein RodZ